MAADGALRPSVYQHQGGRRREDRPNGRLIRAVFGANDVTTTAQPGNPLQNGVGGVRQGWLEASNVEPVQELIDLITTQRSFELNSQTVQAGDQGIRFLLVSGKPIEEPVAWYGPIVMNTDEQLRQAMSELQAGTFIKHP